MNERKERIAVIGLGYVGLPAALAFADSFREVRGFDSSSERVKELRSFQDARGAASEARLRASGLQVTDQPADLADANFFVVAVPTPVDENRQPDLSALTNACETLGPFLSRGDVVVFESTVWPGVTEEICGPALAGASGLVQGRDFQLGYSPERINPGDSAHQFDNVVKVVAAENAEVLDRVARVYEKAISAGVFRARSIKVAEAAKVIENTQRDLNIALMNELAVIFDRLGITTADVLAAARTKWNFMPFTPGLVGGHCIGVDPYYLSSKAKQAGHYPQLMLTARRINDGMSNFVANKLIKLLIAAGATVKGARVAVLGVAFKENVADIRNSRVPEIVRELKDIGIEVYIVDPKVDPLEAREEYGLDLVDVEALDSLDGMVLAVPHAEFIAKPERLYAAMKNPGVLVDVKSALSASNVPSGMHYWSL